MPYADYPTLEDLQAALEDAGLGEAAPSEAALTLALKGAIGQWKRECDWPPFLALSEPSEKKFTLCNAGVLFLRAGLVEAPISVFVDGSLLTPDVDYWLEPANAIAENEPLTRIRFRFRRSSLIQGCVVLGRWGFCQELPDEVWNGVLALAAYNLRGELQRRFSDLRLAAQNAAGLVKAKESGPLRVEYATADGSKFLDLSATFEAWQCAYEMALAGRVMQTP